MKTSKQFATIFYVPTTIYFVSAVWSLFTDADRLVYLAELQTALLFLILATLAKNKA